MAEAARRLNLTPAALAQRIRALERDVGAPLLARSGRTVVPTEARQPRAGARAGLPAGGARPPGRRRRRPRGRRAARRRRDHGHDGTRAGHPRAAREEPSARAGARLAGNLGRALRTRSPRRAGRRHRGPPGFRPRQDLRMAGAAPGTPRPGRPRDAQGPGPGRAPAPGALHPPLARIRGGAAGGPLPAKRGDHAPRARRDHFPVRDRDHGGPGARDRARAGLAGALARGAAAAGGSPWTRREHARHVGVVYPRASVRSGSVRAFVDAAAAVADRLSRS